MARIRRVRLTYWLKFSPVAMSSAWLSAVSSASDETASATEAAVSSAVLCVAI